MGQITPGGYWSHTLGQDMICLRRVYYRVYGSFGGWDPRNGSTSHLLYRAKCSNTLPTYTGTLVHYAIKRIIERVRARLRVAPSELMLQRLEERMRWEIDYSRRERWRHVENPKRATLVLRQHLLGEDLHKPEIEEFIDRGKRSLSAFLDDFLPWIRTTPKDQIFLIDSLDSIPHRGFKLFMSSDLVIAYEGRKTIIDWKTGEQSNIDQLMAYAKHLLSWWEREKGESLEVTSITGRSVPLLHPENEATLQVQPEHIDLAMDRINQDITVLKSVHDEGIARNELAFPKTEHTGECDHCSFQFYCDLRPR